MDKTAIVDMIMSSALPAFHSVSSSALERAFVGSGLDMRRSSFPLCIMESEFVPDTSYVVVMSAVGSRI